MKQYATHLSDEDIAEVARATDGMSGRDLRDIAEQTERRTASKVMGQLVSVEAMSSSTCFLATFMSPLLTLLVQRGFFAVLCCLSILAFPRCHKIKWGCQGHPVSPAQQSNLIYYKLWPRVCRKIEACSVLCRS